MRASDAVAPTLIVMVLGAWLSLENLTIPGFVSEANWPLLIIAAGLCFLIGYFMGASSWQLFLGSGAILESLPLLAFTTGLLDWNLLPSVWPIFVLMAGVTCLIYVVGTPQIPWPLLVVALGALGIGAAGLLFFLDVVALDPVQQLKILWPLLLLGTGFIGLMQVLWQCLDNRR